MPNNIRPLKVFLCHAHSDKADVKALYERLIKDGVDVWLDKEKLLPGQDWELEIRKAVRESDVIVICLSNEFNSAGFRQKEVRLALDTAMEKPEGEIFIIPARLEACETLESLRTWHWVDLFDDNGYDKLLRALRARANSIGATLQAKRSRMPKTSSPRVKTEKPIEVGKLAASPLEETPAKKTVTESKSSRIPSITARKPFKLKTEYIVAIIGAAATIIAAVIGSPWIGTWFTQSPEPTATLTTQVSITPTITTSNRILKLAKTANPPTYDHVGQQITYTYVVTNSGKESIGPAQFIVTDPGFSTPLNCGKADLTLAPNEFVSCSLSYAVTQADMDAGSITTNATVSGGGVGPSEPASTTVTKGPTSNLTPGATIQHQVEPGESLFQIARCYGADFEKVLSANPQLIDPRNLSSGTVVTVPNIGSAGEIYGPPCVTFYTVQSGDTWQSIAIKFNADVTVLIEANQDITLARGAKLLIPSNSILTIPIAPSLSTLFTVDAVVFPNLDNCYGPAIPPGQVAYFKTTTSAGQVTQEVHNPDDQLHKDTGDLILGGSPDAKSGGYRFCIFNRSALPISYTLEVSLSR